MKNSENLLNLYLLVLGLLILVIVSWFKVNRLETEVEYRSMILANQQARLTMLLESVITSIDNK